jgi:choice-of-anchor A domain-containing protein
MQGIVGSAGNITLQNVAVGQSSFPSEQTLISGGSLNLKHVGIYNGGLESLESIDIQNASVRGNISTAGDCRGANGFNQGSIKVQGRVRTQGWQYKSVDRSRFNSKTDHDDVVRQIRTWSQRLTQLTPTQSFRNIENQTLVCEAVDNNDFTVCEAPTSILDNVGEIVFIGFPQHVFVLNLRGTAPAYFGGKKGVKSSIGSKFRFVDSRTGQDYIPDNPAETFIWNFPETTFVGIDRTAFWGTLIAPEAQLLSTQDVRMIGRLFVGELKGNGQINRRFYDEPSSGDK